MKIKIKKISINAIYRHFLIDTSSSGARGAKGAVTLDANFLRVVKMGFRAECNVIILKQYFMKIFFFFAYHFLIFLFSEKIKKRFFRLRSNKILQKSLAPPLDTRKLKKLVINIISIIRITRLKEDCILEN